MWQDMLAFLESWFVYPGVVWDFKLIGIALGLVYAVLWLMAYWPPVLKRYWLPVTLVGGGLLTVLASSFIQMPLQTWLGQAMSHTWSQQTLADWILLASLPQMILSGLVYEGAKMVPIVIWWWRAGKEISPKFGLIIGAFAGAGIGIFEAVWTHLRLFGAGWTIQAIETDGFLGVSGFWERFFVLGFHIALSGIAGYALAKGKGWVGYLIAAGLHAILSWGAVFYYKEYLNIAQLETFVAVYAVIVAAVVLWLRWERSEESGAEPVEVVEDILEEGEQEDD